MPPLDRASYLAGEVAPVPQPAGGPSGLLALGLVTAVLVALVGISLVEQTGGERPHSPAAIAGPTAAATPDIVPTASPTASLPAPGTPPPRVSVEVGAVPSCPLGSTPDRPGPINQTRPAGFASQLAFDRRAGRLVVVSDPGFGRETWAFDVCTNTWTQLHPTREPPDFAYRPLVYDVDSDLTLGIADGPDGAPPAKVWAYDLGADTWTERPAPPDAALLAYDPLSGDVLGSRGSPDDATRPELSSYDVETDTWTTLPQENEPYGGVVAYDASVDRMVVVGGGAARKPTWLFDIRTGTWSRSRAETPVVEWNWAVPEITYDEAAARTVVMGSAGSAAYDAASDRWEILIDQAVNRPLWLRMVYDPVNERLVGFALGGAAVEGDVVAFDLVTREWTVLLETRG